MRRLIVIGLVVVLALGAVAVFIGPMLIPAEVYKAEISKAVEKATGRSFKIAGGVHLAVFPGIKAVVEKASLGNAPGGKADTMAEIGRMSVGLKLFPLLSRHFEISSFVLEDAVIHFETDANGKPNWKFDTAKAETADSGAKGAQQVKEVSLGDVRVVNGLVTYDNAKTGARYELSRITASLGLPNLDSPFKLSGKATYKEQELNLTATAAKARALIEGGTTELSADVKSALLNAAFNGTGTFGDKLALEGDTKLDSPSVRKLAGWLGKPISGDTGFGALTVAGKAVLEGQHLAFNDAKLHFDEIDATGSLAADLSGARPNITGNLASPKLDLRPYTGGSDKAAPASAVKSDVAGWSNEPIDASALRSFDAALDLTADAIYLRDIKIDKSDVAVTVAGGILTANLKQLGLYSGNAKGKLVVDGRQTPATISTDLNMAGLDLTSFMKDAAKTDRFEGTGNFDFNLKGSGHSQAELVSNLGGSTKINFTNGAIKGIDLAKIASIISSLTGKTSTSSTADGQTGSTGQAATTDQGQSAGDSTKFVALGANFAVTNGIMRTSDFSMINDLISLSGGGSIDLVHMTIDFRLTPGTNQKNGGIRIALRITGPLGHPKISPDASGMIQNEIQKRLGDNPAATILDKLLNKGDKTPDGQTQPAPKKNLLDELLRGGNGN